MTKPFVNRGSIPKSPILCGRGSLFDLSSPKSIAPFIKATSTGTGISSIRKLALSKHSTTEGGGAGSHYLNALIQITLMKYFVIPLALLSAACAKQPDQISSANFVPNPYTRHSCKNLAQEKLNLSQSLEKLSAA